MRQKLKKKLKSNGGESLLEAILAIFIVTLTFAFLCTSVSVANRLNAVIKKTNVDFTFDLHSMEAKTLIAVTEESGVNDDNIMTPDAVNVCIDETETYHYYE